MHTLRILFQRISRTLSTQQKAFLAILLSFAVFAVFKMVLGGVPWYVAATVAPMFFISLLYPTVGLSALIVLTVLFERFFTLEGFQLGRDVVKLYPLDIILFGLYVHAAAKFIFRKSLFIFRSTDSFFFLFFFLATAYFVLGLAGFGTHEVSVAFSTWKNYVFYGALVFVLPIILETENDMRRMMKHFLAAAGCAIIFLLIGVVRGEGLWTEYTPLSTAGVRLLAFPHAFYFSLAFLGVFATAGYWFRDTRRFFIFGALGLWSVGIIGSLMRHMWIGMGLAVLIAFFFLMDHTARRTAWRVSVMACSSVIVLLSMAVFLSNVFPYADASRSFQTSIHAVVERAVSIGNSSDESISWRSSTWQSAFSELEKHPLFGSGFGVRVAVESGEEYRDFVEVRNIHNSWFAILVQMGIVGMTMLVAAIGILIVLVARLGVVGRNIRIARLVFLTLIAYQSVVLLAQPYLETNLTGIFFWMTLGSLRTLLVFSGQERTPDMVSEKILNI